MQALLKIEGGSELTVGEWMHTKGVGSTRQKIRTASTKLAGTQTNERKPNTMSLNPSMSYIENPRNLLHLIDNYPGLRLVTLQSLYLGLPLLE